MSLYNNTLSHNARQFYDLLFYDLADPRTNHWPLITHPWGGILILVGYWYFVKDLGPKLMKNRQPFELKNILILYNLIQVLVSTYIFFEGLDAAWLTKYSWRCEPVDFSDNPHAMRIARGVYTYFIAKVSELLDTIFFVLRKKDSQITFLHMYHHTVMPIISWGCTKYYPGGHGTFIGVLNSFVHIIMYFYYMMAAMGSKYQKYLWWKKYITTLQLSQFCIAFFHSMQLLFYDCGYPRWSMFFTLPNAIFFYYLFSDFYNKAYTKKIISKHYENDCVKAKDSNVNEKHKGEPITNNPELSSGKQNEEETKKRS